MDFNFLPDEVIKKIISYLAIDDAKSIALSSKKIYSLSMTRLWTNRGKLNIGRYNTRDLDFLYKINVTELPIREAHCRNFDCSWLEVVSLLPQLQLLHVDIKQDDRERQCPQDSQLTYLKVPIVLHTCALSIVEAKKIPIIFWKSLKQRIS